MGVYQWTEYIRSSSSTLMLELVHIQIVMPKSINYSKNKYF